MHVYERRFTTGVEADKNPVVRAAMEDMIRARMVHDVFRESARRVRTDDVQIVREESILTAIGEEDESHDPITIVAYYARVEVEN